MRQQAINYAKALLELTADRETVDVLGSLPEKAPLFGKILSDPMIPREKKRAFLDAICRKANLPETIGNFLKYLCGHGETELLEEIVRAYDACWDEANHIVRAEIAFASDPAQQELERAVHFLEKTYPGKEIRTTVSTEKKLLGGMRIRVGHTEYDWSYDGRLRQLAGKLTVR